MNKVGVYFNEDLTGFLIKTDKGTYIFEYQDVYWKDARKSAISLTLPKSQKVFHSEVLFPVFSNLLAEGANRKVQCKYFSIDEQDDFSLLLATAQTDTIGAITIKSIV